MQQVRQNVLIADDLAAQFQTVVGRMAKAAADPNDGETSTLRAESERLYTGMWEHLDAAAAQTRAAGRSTESYDAIRTSTNAYRGVNDVRSDVTDIKFGVTKDIITVRGTVDTNAQGITAACHASAALKQLWPDVDWTPPPPTPDIDLRPRGFFSRLFGR